MLTHLDLFLVAPGPGDDSISNSGGNFYRDVTLEIRGDEGDDTIDISAFVNPKNVFGGKWIWCH